MDHLPTRALVLSLLTLAPVLAQQTPKLEIKSFSVGPGQTLSYPNNPANPNYLIDLPDEHTTILPPPASGAPYLVFAASNISGGNWGAVVLQSTDLKSFDFATGYNHEVLTARCSSGNALPLGPRHLTRIMRPLAQSCRTPRCPRES